MFRLVPAIDTGSVRHDFGWARRPAPGWLILTRDPSDTDVAAVLAALATYGARAAGRGSVSRAAAAVAGADRLILPGGLLPMREGVTIGPGCCAGLETWRDWLTIAPGSASPWLGHDPWMLVDCGPDEAVIWQDNTRTDDTPRIAATYEEIGRARDEAARDMAGFADAFDAWLYRHAPNQCAAGDAFRRSFRIG